VDAVALGIQYVTMHADLDQLARSRQADLVSGVEDDPDAWQNWLDVSNNRN